MGVISVPIALIILWRLRPLLLTDAIPSWVELSVAAVLAVLVFQLLPSRRQLRRLASYPAPWVGGLFGGAVVLWIVSLSATIQRAFGLLGTAVPMLQVLGGGCLAVMVIAISGSVLMDRLSVARALRRRTDSTEGRQQGAVLETFSGLCAWLEGDEAIRSPQNDAFSHSAISRRIADRLLQDDLPAQAVIGRLGSGKTTVRELVAHELVARGGDDSLRLIPVELWPYETPRAAVEGVIRSVVDCLSQEVSLRDLRGMPAAYAEAITAAGGLLSVLARIQSIPAKPLDALARVDEVACCLGLRLVVWVEDLERFAGSRLLDAAEPESGEEAQRLAPIRALLLGLDRLRSVTVVTATTSLYARFDLEKIARYVEEIPPLAEYDVRRTLAIFRDGCRALFDDVDPGAAVRKELDRLNRGDEAYLASSVRRSLLMPRVSHISDALAVFCRTPRTMKQGLRNCFETWRMLHGEIDFDDLLAMTLLRESVPSAFAVIREHIDTLRHRGELTKESKEARQRWEKALEDLHLDADSKDAVGQVVRFVFGPQWESKKLQGLMRCNHTDYWERFLAVPVLGSHERDQPVLDVLIQNDDGSLLALLEGTRSAAVENFASLLSTDRLERLFLPLVARRTLEDRARWPRMNPPGLIPLWRMWLRRSERGELRPETVLGLVKEAYDLAVPTNLALVEHIEHYFVLASSQVHDLLSRPDYPGASRRAEAKGYLRRLLVVRYGGAPERLARALRGLRPETFRTLIWGRDRIYSNRFDGKPFEEWQEFAATLVKAGHLNPPDVLPQVAHLVVSEADDVMLHGSIPYDFDAELTERLFGNRDTILDLFRVAADGLPADDAAVAAVLRAARGAPGEKANF